MPKITALCVEPNSIYKQLGIDSYDIRRNARTYTGTHPIIGHPPCRGYSAFLQHRSKPEPGERDLALFVTERIRLYGGILEHPKHSRYVRRFIGKPGWQILEVNQKWFGYPTTKSTWLLMPDYYETIQPPFNLEMTGPNPVKIENLSKHQRSRTTLAFAKYLIAIIEKNHDN